MNSFTTMAVIPEPYRSSMLTKLKAKYSKTDCWSEVKKILPKIEKLKGSIDSIDPDGNRFEYILNLSEGLTGEDHRTPEVPLILESKESIKLYNKKITVITPVLRPKLLQRAIVSFQAQEYPNKEMIIINDSPKYKLLLKDCPENIKIVNLGFKTNNLGSKLNIACELATGDILTRLDDDDFYFGQYLISAAKLSDGFNQDCFMFDSHIFKNGDNSLSFKNFGLSASLFFSKESFHKVGGFIQKHNGVDWPFVTAVRDVLRVPQCESTEGFYIYEWGNGHKHASNEPNGIDDLFDSDFEINLNSKPYEIECETIKREFSWI